MLGIERTAARLDEFREGYTTLKLTLTPKQQSLLIELREIRETLGLDFERSGPGLAG